MATLDGGGREGRTERGVPFWPLGNETAYFHQEGGREGGERDWVSRHLFIFPPFPPTLGWCRFIPPPLTARARFTLLIDFVELYRAPGACTHTLSHTHTHTHTHLPMTVEKKTADCDLQCDTG